MKIINSIKNHFEIYFLLSLIPISIIYFSIKKNTLSIQILGPAYYTNFPKHWWKGNTHCHSNRSDGDSPPYFVLNWYKNHKYNFIGLSDHNKAPLPDSVNTEFETKNFILLKAEELSWFSKYDGFHFNSLFLSYSLYPFVLQRGNLSKNNILKQVWKKIKNEKGIIVINHLHYKKVWLPPNLNDIPDKSFIEVYNSHPNNFSFHGKDSRSDEDYWDILLSQEKKVYAIASDDAHSFLKNSPKPIPSRPGGGFVFAAADKLNKQEILKAYQKGNFYASSGVKVKNIEYKNNLLQISIENKNIQYSSILIGYKGKILQKQNKNPAVFNLEKIFLKDKRLHKKKKTFYRIKICNTKDKTFAWLQPFRLKAKKMHKSN